MKYVIVLGDGMADRPSIKNGFVTALESANTPVFTFMAQNGTVGMVKTVPDGMKPGSDVANLSVFGMKPDLYYTGRAPIEALSMGIEYDLSDVAYRTNLVNISGAVSDPESVMVSYSAGDVSSSEANELVGAVSEALNNELVELYSGVSYRHCTILRGGDTGAQLTPPHDITGKKIGQYMPKGVNAELLTDLMVRAQKILEAHPVNAERVKRGLLPANSIWFWGEGRRPNLPSFEQKYGIKGAVVSAVDIIKGIGAGSGMTVIEVEGATGNVDTNYEGKAEAVVNALKTHDFVFVHVEAPDECGHSGKAAEQAMAIEDLDRRLLARVIASADEWEGGLSVMLLPDHATPVEVMTHTGEPVPFVIWRSTEKGAHPTQAFTEALAKDTGLCFEDGERLINCFLQR